MEIDNMKNMKNLLLGLFFTVTSVLTLPAYAWPEVDHMNMCGTATKVVQSYGGNWKGWNQHDKYIAARGNAYYLRSNCPTIVAPVKSTRVKKASMKAYSKKVVTKRIAKSTKARSFKRTVVYDMKADCARVDRMNGYGSAVSQSAAKRSVVVKRVAKSKYNYFKKK